MKRNKAWIALLTALCLTFMLVGCASKSASSARSDYYYTEQEAAYNMEAPAAMADEAYYGEAKAAGKV